MVTQNYPPPPRKTANPAPLRPANSIRRTSSIDVAWPDGPSAPRLMVGRARDFVTVADGTGEMVSEGGFRLRMTEDKTIVSISGHPPHAKVETLVGERGGGHLRKVLAERLPELLESNDPLYLVLDDISGTALVSGFAWSQWDSDWAEKLRDQIGAAELEKMMEARINICWGLQEGYTGATNKTPNDDIANADAGELVNRSDPQGWHTLVDEDGAGFRRARRIDVTRDERKGVLRIDSAFQDSAKLKTGGRMAIHEYLLRATCDSETLEILTLEPEARILPYAECPGAVHNVTRLIGKRLDHIRGDVLALLRGPEGCTHLNDALRALADVPRLAGKLAEKLKVPA